MTGLAIVQCLLGSVLLAVPSRCAALLKAPREPAPPAMPVRIFGLRMVAQGSATLARPSTAVLAGGVAVDALHALSMIPFMFRAGRGRRAAIVSASWAVLSGAVTTHAITSGRRVAGGRS